MKANFKLALGAALLVPLFTWAADPVPYLDWDPVAKEMTNAVCTVYEEVTDATSLFEDGRWYVVTNGATISRCGIEVTGSAHLILCDGGQLRVEDYETAGLHVAEGNALSIYGQRGQSGSLEATGGKKCAGIGGASDESGGTVTINGGSVRATGDGVWHSTSVPAWGNWGGAGIGSGANTDGTRERGGTVVINGGRVVACGGYCGAGIGGGDAASGADVTINGGMVWAWGGGYKVGDPYYATGIGSGQGYGEPGTLTVAADVVVRASAKTEEWADMPVLAHGEDGSVSPNYNSATYKARKINPAPSHMAVTYVDASGTEFVCDDAIVLTADTYILEDGRTYVVPPGAEVTCPASVSVTGSVNLVLCDGSRLRIYDEERSAGLRVKAGMSLAIYGQAAGTGVLEVEGGKYSAGIGGGYEEACGTVRIEGGVVTATGGYEGAGIGGGEEGNGGTVTINGGTVTATGEGGAGIGGGCYSGGGTVTINGGTVTAEGYAGIGGGEEGNGGTVTINGGTVTAMGVAGAGIGGGYYHGNGGTVTINGGTVTAIGDYDGAGIGGGYYGKGGTVTINGGTVTAIGDSDAAGIGGGYEGNGGTVTINGGTVTAIGDSDAAGIGAGYGGEGGTLEINGGRVLAPYHDGPALTGTVTISADMIAWLGGAEAVPDENGKIGLTENDGERFLAMERSAIQTAEVSYLDETGNKLTHVCIIVDEDTENFADGGWYVVPSGATLSNNTISVSGSAHLVLGDGSRLTAVGYRSCAGLSVTNGCALTIYGQKAGTGVLVAVGGNAAAGIGGGENASGGMVTINGCKVTATGGSSSAAGIGGGEEGNGGTVTVNGGMVTAVTGGYYGAGIGGGYRGDGGTVTVNGGVVSAIGEDDGAGIGGGYYGKGGTVTVNGGTVTAINDGAGAAIGGGYRGVGATVTIKGGTVTAANDGSGAAIGGGYNGNGGTVTIDGGTVTATNGFTGAAIGGGESGSGGEVTVNGGTVTATGSKGAAIGGGYYGNGGTVTINGGTVTAIGSSGAGIGGGYYGAGGALTINNGTVMANSDIGAGVGRGCYGSSNGSLTVGLDIDVAAGYDPDSLEEVLSDSEGAIGLDGSRYYVFSKGYDPLVPLAVNKTISFVREDLIGFTAGKLPTGLKFDSATGTFSGKVKTATVATVTFTRGDEQQLMVIRIGNVSKVTVLKVGSGKITPTSKIAAPGKSVTFKATPSSGYVFSEWHLMRKTPYGYREVKSLGRSPTLTYKISTDAEQFIRAHFISSRYDYKPSVYVRNKSSGYSLYLRDIVRIYVGVPVSYQLSADAASLVKMSVSSLPKGLKFNAKTGVISGVPSKVQNVSATIKATNVSKKTTTAGIAFQVLPLPDWARGSFNGVYATISPSSYAVTYQGPVTLSVGATGKISGKIIVKGVAYAFSAKSFSTYVEPESSSFYMTVTPKYKTKSLGTMTLRLRRNDGVGNVIGGDSTETKAVSAVQNIWKRTDDIRYEVPVFPKAGVALKLKSGLSFKIGAKGVATASGSVQGDKARVKVSASSQIFWAGNLSEDVFEATAVIYVAPKTGLKKGYLEIVSLRLGMNENGVVTEAVEVED